MIDDDFKDVLPMDAIVRATEVLKKPTPLDIHNKVRLAIIATGLPQELRSIKAWVEDLSEFKQGTYVRCSFCGEKAEIKRGESNRIEWLRKHIEKCEKHPMAALKKEVAALKEKLEGKV